MIKLFLLFIFVGYETVIIVFQKKKIWFDLIDLGKTNRIKGVQQAPFLSTSNRESKLVASSNPAPNAYDVNNHNDGNRFDIFPSSFDNFDLVSAFAMNDLEHFTWFI